MALARDLIGAAAMLTAATARRRRADFVPGTDTTALGPASRRGTLDHPGWYDGFMFSQALTIGGGTGEVQRNIVAERVLGLPHDVDVAAGAVVVARRRRPATPDDRRGARRARRASPTS